MIPLGFFSFGGGYWLALSNTQLNAETIHTNGTQTVLGGYLSNEGFYSARIDAGLPTWQNRFYYSARPTSSGTRPFGVTRDSSGNIYFVGSGVAATTDADGIVVKCSSSGGILWEKYYRFSSLSDRINGVAVAPSGNIYVSGWRPISLGITGSILKLDANGEILWEKNWGATDGIQYYDIGIDSSENVYTTGLSNVGGTWYLSIIKTDSAGATVWQRRIANTNSSPRAKLKVTSSGESYIIFQNAANTAATLMKINTNSTVAWQRTLTGDAIPTDVGIDESQNAYVFGVRNLTTSRSFLAKYDASGTLLFQREISAATQISVAPGFASNTAIAFAGFAGASATLVGLLPVDGSKTGTYTVGSLGVTYGAGTLTDSAGALTLLSSSYSVGNGSTTAQVSALTQQTPSVTYSSKTI